MSYSTKTQKVIISYIGNYLDNGCINMRTHEDSISLEIIRHSKHLNRQINSIKSQLPSNIKVHTNYQERLIFMEVNTPADLINFNTLVAFSALKKLIEIKELELAATEQYLETLKALALAKKIGATNQN